MRQGANQPPKTRRKHCKSCGELFDGHPRAKGRQRYCSKEACQSLRQRQNEKDWYQKNPDLVAAYKRKWQQKHQGYSRQRRCAEPDLAEKNRQDTKIRMQKWRAMGVFDKNKPILTQMVGNKRDKCFLMSGNWLFLRLTRTSPWQKVALIRHTYRGKIKRVANRH